MCFFRAEERKKACEGEKEESLQERFPKCAYMHTRLHLATKDRREKLNEHNNSSWPNFGIMLVIASPEVVDRSSPRKLRAFLPQ